MNKIKLAFIGCGDVAQRDYLPEFHRIADRAEIVAVCGRTESRARAVAEQYPVRAWYTDYRRMLAETDAEAVVNLTPMQLHAETNLAALKAGKHVYTEKPVAAHVREVEQLREEVRQRKLKLVCAPCEMLFPQIKRARALLAESVLGEVYSARGHGHGGVPPWGGYASDPSQFFAEGGGPAFDMGVYPLHALTGLLGPARRVTAMTSRTRSNFTVESGPVKGKLIPMEVDDNWHFILDFGNRRLASVDANNCVQASRAPQLEVFGMQGTLAIDLLDVSAPIEILRAGANWEKVELPRTGRASGPDHLLGIEHLVDCIQRDQEPVLSVDHALHVVEIIEKAAQSSAEGRTLELKSTF